LKIFTIQMNELLACIQWSPQWTVTHPPDLVLARSHPELC
jgi:hypothetical protein